MKAILLDIEGTTTPIDFVHETLFPYAKARVSGYVEENLDQLRIEIAELTAEHEKDTEYSGELRVDSSHSIGEYLKFLIDTDRKSTPLKSIQGLIWQRGYESGELHSSVFDDVAAAFKRWKEEEKTVAIYSSGSVLAQKLLFQHTDHGDLTNCIDRYFDTNVGHKREIGSYEKIAGELEMPGQEIVFVSDIVAELDAAQKAGMQTALTIRDGNPEITESHSHPVIKTFDDLPV